MTTTIPAQADLTITSGATHADAMLLMQVLNGPMAGRAMDGMSLLWTYDAPPTHEQFLADHPKNSDGYKAVGALMALNETIGTFVKRGLIDRGLVHDMLWVKGAWDRCEALALHDRAEMGVAALWENFEALAADQT